MHALINSFKITNRGNNISYCSTSSRISPHNPFHDLFSYAERFFFQYKYFLKPLRPFSQSHVPICEVSVFYPAAVFVPAQTGWRTHICCRKLPALHILYGWFVPCVSEIFFWAELKDFSSKTHWPPMTWWREYLAWVLMKVFPATLAHR